MKSVCKIYKYSIRIRGFKGSRELLKNYKELMVWQKSYRLCLGIYKVTKKYPQGEKYGLTSQMRRAALSIPSNIAEEYGRKTTPEYIRFLYIAYGSTCELETQLLLSGDLGYLNEESLSEFQKKIGRLKGC
jgi:four helix bundle protein